MKCALSVVTKSEQQECFKDVHINIIILGPIESEKQECFGGWCFGQLCAVSIV